MNIGAMLYYAVAITGMFGVIILTHELGHFIAAKWAGVWVDRFSLGFGPALFRRKWGETEFRIGVIPLGGYVDMPGQDPTAGIDAPLGMKDFRMQPVYKKIIIAISGSFFNIILAFLILCIVFYAGIPSYAPVIGTVVSGSPAEKAGVLPGDRFISLDGVSTPLYEDVIRIVQDSPERRLSGQIQRGDLMLEVEIIPEKKTGYDALNRSSDTGYLGVTPEGEKILKTSGFLKSMSLSLKKCSEMVSHMITAIKMLVTGQMGADNIGGPVMIAKMASKELDNGVVNFLFSMAFISVNLGIFNLIPFPVLDGGLVVFLLIEQLIGRPINPRIMHLIQWAGMACLAVMSVFVFYLDIMRFLV